MDRSCIYCITVEGHLAEHWSDWFGGLSIHPDPGGQTTLSGCLPDQSALLGVLARIHALNLTLVAVCRSAPEAATQTPDG